MLERSSDADVAEPPNFGVTIINQGVLPAGNYRLTLTPRDGKGDVKKAAWGTKVALHGGDEFAVEIGNKRFRPIRGVRPDATWRGGYLTVEAKLEDAAGKVVAEGCEQVLWKNRASFGKDLAALRGAVAGWPAAAKALADAGCSASEWTAQSPTLQFITAGENVADDQVDELLRRVEHDGTLLLVKFDAKWAGRLFKEGLLSQPVTEWGGRQTPKANGNGWGYLEHFVGDQTLSGRAVVSTTSWEAPRGPVGFYPFASTKRLAVYGLHVSRPADWSKSDAKQTLLVLLGTIDHGKGKIILAPSYPVDRNTAFCDLLFYNMITMGCAGKW